MRPAWEWRLIVEPGISFWEFQSIVSTKNLGDQANSSDQAWADLPRFMGDPNHYV